MLVVMSSTVVNGGRVVAIKPTSSVPAGKAFVLYHVSINRVLRAGGLAMRTVDVGLETGRVITADKQSLVGWHPVCSMAVQWSVRYHRGFNHGHAVR